MGRWLPVGKQTPNVGTGWLCAARLWLVFRAWAAAPGDMSSCARSVEASQRRDGRQPATSGADGDMPGCGQSAGHPRSRRCSSLGLQRNTASVSRHRAPAALLLAAWPTPRGHQASSHNLKSWHATSKSRAVSDQLQPAFSHLGYCYFFYTGVDCLHYSGMCWVGEPITIPPARQ